MQIQLTGHNVALSAALREYAEARLAQSLSPLIEDSATEVQVMLSHEHGADPDQAMLCRVNALIPHEGQVVVARASSDMYKSIDMVHDTLLNQTKHLLERHHDKHRARKDAEKERAHVARQNMTTFEDADTQIAAQTEREVAAFEQSARP